MSGAWSSGGQGHLCRRDGGLAPCLKKTHFFQGIYGNSYILLTNISRLNQVFCSNFAHNIELNKNFKYHCWFWAGPGQRNFTIFPYLFFVHLNFPRNGVLAPGALCGKIPARNHTIAISYPRIDA